MKAPSHSSSTANDPVVTGALYVFMGRAWRKEGVGVEEEEEKEENEEEEEEEEVAGQKLLR